MPEIYALVFSDGKAYIGATKHNVQRRFGAHKRLAEAGHHLPVHEAWRRLGAPNAFVLGRCCDHEELLKEEAAAIALHGTLFPKGYNTTAGGSTTWMKGRKHTEEAKAKQRSKKLGTKLSPEHKAKIGAAILGRKHNQSAKDKVRAARLGKVTSSETRARQSDARKAYFARLKA